MRLPVLIVAALCGLMRAGVWAADEAKPAAADAVPALPLPAEVVDAVQAAEFTTLSA